MAGCHGLDRFFRENALAVVCAAVEHHAAENSHVFRRGKQAACWHGAAGTVGKWITQLDDADRLQIVLGGVWFVRERQALDLLVVGPEGGVGHAQGLEQALVEKLLERHATDNFDNAPRRVDAGVGILIFCARLGLQRGFGIAANTGCQGKSVERGFFRGGLERHAAGVVEAIADGDGSSRGLEHGAAFGIFVSNFQLFKLGQVLFDRIVKFHLAFIHQNHQCRGRDGFRLRGDPEHGVVGHRFARRDIGKADRFHRECFVFVGNQNNSTCQRVFFHKWSQGLC